MYFWLQSIYQWVFATYHLVKGLQVKINAIQQTEERIMAAIDDLKQNLVDMNAAIVDEFVAVDAALAKLGTSSDPAVADAAAAIKAATDNIKAETAKVSAALNPAPAPVPNP